MKSSLIKLRRLLMDIKYNQVRPLNPSLLGSGIR